MSSSVKPPQLTHDARDLRGYGENRPDPKWPDGARVAISLVVNIETGSELSLADGDERNEILSEFVDPVEDAPDYNLRSHFDYGPRVGYWRVMRLLKEYNVPCTATAAGRAIERAPWVAQNLIKRGHEVACHGYRWERHADRSEAREREVIRKTIAILEAATGVRPVGWLCRGSASKNTRRLLAEEFGFLYDSDAYDDDLPHIQMFGPRSYGVVPFAFDANDMRFMAGGSFVHADDFARYCIDTFDQLYREGETHPTMMSIGLHPRLIGRPGRIAGLERFLEHVQAKGGAWFARRIDIAHHWHERMGLAPWEPMI